MSEPRWYARPDGRRGSDECCNGDRCDDPTHVDRRNCKACGGTGILPDAKPAEDPLTAALRRAEEAEAKAEIHRLERADSEAEALELRGVAAQAEADRDTWKARAEEAEATVADLRAAIDRNYAVAHERIATLTERAEEAERERDEARRFEAESEERRVSTLRQIGEVNAKLAAAEEQRDRYQSDLAGLVASRDAWKARAEEAEARAEAAEEEREEWAGAVGAALSPDFDAGPPEAARSIAALKARLAEAERAHEAAAEEGGALMVRLAEAERERAVVADAARTYLEKGERHRGALIAALGYLDGEPDCVLVDRAEYDTLSSKLAELVAVHGDGTMSRADIVYTRGYQKGREEAEAALSARLGEAERCAGEAQDELRAIAALVEPLPYTAANRVVLHAVDLALVTARLERDEARREAEEATQGRDPYGRTLDAIENLDAENADLKASLATTEAKLEAASAALDIANRVVATIEDVTARATRAETALTEAVEHYNRDMPAALARAETAEAALVELREATKERDAAEAAGDVERRYQQGYELRPDGETFEQSYARATAVLDRERAAAIRYQAALDAVPTDLASAVWHRHRDAVVRCLRERAMKARADAETAKSDLVAEGLEDCARAADFHADLVAGMERPE